jgi:hypothetical protein
MGWACGTYGRQERCVQGFGGKAREREHFEDLGVDRRLILKWLLREWDEWTGFISFRIGTGGGLL